MAEGRLSGYIVTYNRERGFGFIQSDKHPKPIWFHYSRIINTDRSDLYDKLNSVDDLSALNVSFVLFEAKQGWQAKDIELIGPYQDVRTFLRETSAENGKLLDRFVELLSFDVITFLDADANLTQAVVSRILNSAEVWQALVDMSNHGKISQSLVGSANKWSDNDQRVLTEFGSDVTRVLGLDVLSIRPLHIVRAIQVDLRQPNIPLRCFRQAQDNSIVIVGSVDQLKTLSRNDSDLVTSTRRNFKFILPIDRITNNFPIDESSISKHAIILDQQTLIRLAITARDQHPYILGKLFRRTLALHVLQPYEVGSAYDELIFSGRANERERVLFDSTGNYAVYGGRKIGKTWFLKDICHHCRTTRSYAKEYLPVYVSLQVARSIDDAVYSIDEAIRVELGKLAIKVSDSRAESPLNRLRFIVRKAHEATGKTLLLALDEIDDVLKLPDSNSLFGVLRAVQETYAGSAKYIFAGFKELISAFSDHFSNNPFANWIGDRHFSLGCLSEDDVRSLIVPPLEWMGFSFKSKEITSKIMQLTSGHPYYTQFICMKLVEHLWNQHEETILPKHVDQVASEQFFQEIFDVFIANLSTLQLLIGKSFQGRTASFSNSEIVDQLYKQFQIEVSEKVVREQMKVLQACSVFTLTSSGYRPLMEKINEEFFKMRDSFDLAVKYLEEMDNAQ